MELLSFRAWLLLHTLPFLKLGQISYQLRYRLLSKLPAGLGSHLRRQPEQIETQALTPRSPFLLRPSIRLSDIEQRRFTFLNQSAVFEDDVRWKVPDKGRLWRYNLHYFDFLFPDRPMAWAHGRQLIEDWIRSNPEGTPDAWDPFPVSLRMVNWIKFLSTWQADGDLPEIHASLYRQALFLERHLEFHLLANHLFKNIKALLFAGLYFRGADADRWRRRGFRLLTREIDEQILPDGGHFERSPMYHAMILEDVLDLLNILPRRPAGYETLRVRLSRAAEKMVVFLQAMSHPDGGISLFNDAALDIEHDAATLERYFSAVTGKSLPNDCQDRRTAFPDTGYSVMTPAAGDKLIVDCGPVGPDYQPGHAHCDTLSFELSLKGRRVIVDSGCCQYEDGPVRRYNRGNAGHNTVTIDGRNQSEVWGAHRCARRAYPISADLHELEDGTLVFEGAHDGYRRLRVKPVHRRRVHWQQDTIDITDGIEGTGRHTLVSTLHIHPDLEVHTASDGVQVSGSDGPIVRILFKGEHPIVVQKGWYCPEFNRRLECLRLAVAFEATLPVSFGWRIAFH